MEIEVVESVAPARSKNILVVDDNEAAADALVKLLKALGLHAQALYGPRDVPDYLERNTVHMVILDIGMPEMNGYELVGVLRKKGHTTVPIIALTGYGMREDKEKAISAGFDDHYTKPIGVKEIQELLS